MPLSYKTFVFRQDISNSLIDENLRFSVETPCHIQGLYELFYYSCFFAFYYYILCYTNCQYNKYHNKIILLYYFKIKIY